MTHQAPENVPASELDPASEPASGPDDATVPRDTRCVLLQETALVLGVSLGASALWSVLAIVRRLTADVALSQQTSSLNASVTPDRPWLDLAYQLAGILVGVVPAFLALHLLGRDAGGPRPVRAGARRVGLDARRPLRDLAWGAALAAGIGIPGLALYLGARQLGLNTTVAASGLGQAWWAVPVLVLAAAQNALLEETVMVGYLFTRWRQAGWSWPWIVGLSALVRGTYHLYQGFGGFVGNVAMGVILGVAYRRGRRTGPLVVAHTLLDVVAFVGYALFADVLGLR